MNANETFKVKTADERKAEFGAYQKKFHDECRAQVYELAKHIEKFMDEHPELTEWSVTLNRDLRNAYSHLEKLYIDAGFSVKRIMYNVIMISRK